MTSDVVFGIRVWGKGGSCRERIGMDEEVRRRRKENGKQGIKREKRSSQKDKTRVWMEEGESVRELDHSKRVWGKSW